MSLRNTDIDEICCKLEAIYFFVEEHSVPRQRLAEIVEVIEARYGQRFDGDHPIRRQYAT
jgi:hypothetical protein